MNHQKTNPVLGLYIHIPFCKVKCRYCDSASFPGLLNYIARYLKALEKEMDFYKNCQIDTIYFGGGTPSILNQKHWTEMMRNIRSRFILMAPTEITIECNPENITAELVDLYEAPRLYSRGIFIYSDVTSEHIHHTSWRIILFAFIHGFTPVVFCEGG